MDEMLGFADQRRNRNFAETHRQLIERAVQLIGAGGVEALSVATLARDAGMNRSTVYYHFESRDALLLSVRQWVGQRIGDTLLGEDDAAQRLERTVQFVLSHAEVINLWVNELVGAASVRERVPFWDTLVGVMHQGQIVVDGERAQGNRLPDPEVWAAVMLSAALMAPQIFQLSDGLDDDAKLIGERFGQAYGWLLDVLGAPR